MSETSIPDQNHNKQADDVLTYRKYICLVCGWIYDEELGSPEDDLPPGTKWEDVPSNWLCPDCGSSKEDFDMVEIQE